MFSSALPLAGCVYSDYVQATYEGPVVVPQLRDSAMFACTEYGILPEFVTLVASHLCQKVIALELSITCLNNGGVNVGESWPLGLHAILARITVPTRQACEADRQQNSSQGQAAELTSTMDGTFTQGSYTVSTCMNVQWIPQPVPERLHVVTATGSRGVRL